MATLKQKIAFQKVVDSSGKIGIGKAMVEAGYSPKTDTTNLTKSKSWEELMEEHFPDSKISKVIDEGLSANRVISAMNTGKQADGATSDFIEVPDHAIRHKFVETTLKLRNKFPAVKTDVTSGGKAIPILGGITIKEDTETE